MTVVFLNFSNGANPPRSERFFSRAVRVFLALYFTSTALVRDFFFFNSFPTKLRAGTYVYGSYDRGNYVPSTVKEKVFQDVFKISADLDRRLAREESLKWKIPVPRSQDPSSLTLEPCNCLLIRQYSSTSRVKGHDSAFKSWYTVGGPAFSTQCLRVWECARKLWETLRRRSQNLAIWASQRMLFYPTKTLCFFYIYFIAEVLCCFVIRTGEIQFTEPLKNFQVSKAIVVAAEENTVKRSQSQMHMLDSWWNICVDYFTRQ